MTDYTKMIERLRERSEPMTRIDRISLCGDASDAIEALQGENERLKDLELTWRICHERSSDAAQDLANERDALAAENERLIVANEIIQTKFDAQSSVCAMLQSQRDALAAELAGLKAQNQLEDFSFMDAEDAIFEQIHVAARKSFQRHKSAVRGQQFTRADGIDSHLIWAAIEWAKTSAPKALEPLERVAECAARLVEHADFQLGGILSADSKAKDIPSKAVSQVKSRHLAALRDSLAAHGIGGTP